MKVIPIDKYVRTNIDGYNHMISIYHNIIFSDDHDISLDFSRTIWFEANLSSVLGGIIELCKKIGYNVGYCNFKTPVQNILERNGFLIPIDGSRLTVKTDTIISFQKFTPQQGNTFNEYIAQELLSKNDFPKHSPLLGRKIVESIFEIFENARTHGRCDYIHTCGQYYPNSASSRVDMTIVDMGKTIKVNVNEYNRRMGFSAEYDYDADVAIEWAIKQGNTTKEARTGGLGLSLLMDFIKLNKGIVQFVSSDGFLQYKNGEIKKSLLNNLFPGTIVNVEFNFDDNCSYSMKYEPPISLARIF